MNLVAGRLKEGERLEAALDLQPLIADRIRETLGVGLEGLVEDANYDELCRLRASSPLCQQLQDIGVIDAYRSGLLSYLNLSELKDVVTETLWANVFKSKWPPQDIVRSEFKKLLAVRNKVAHFRPVTDRDARVVSRFSEDFRDWTADYRNISQYASELLPSPDERGERLIRKHNLTGFCDSMRGIACDLQVTAVAHHVRVNLACDGVFEPGEICALLDDQDEVATLCRPASGGSRIEFMIPIAAAIDRGVAFATAASATATPGEQLTVAETSIRFEVARRENVVHEGVLFPEAFRA